MAGAGYKTFTVGEVLTASNVQSYLMDQAVMKFASSGARGSAIGTATEGMLSYLADTDAVEVYDGSAWTSIGLPLGTATPADGNILTYGTATSTWNPTAADFGKVLQVQTGNTSTTTSNTTSTPAATSLSVTITPVSASSTIIVYAHANQLRGEISGNMTLVWYLYKDGVSTSVGAALSASTSQRVASVGNAIYADAHGTTSAITYQMYIWRTNDTPTINRVEGQQTIVAVEFA